MTLPELLDSYASLVEHGHADVDLDPTSRKDTAYILKQVAGLRPTTQDTALRLTRQVCVDTNVTDEAAARAVETVTNLSA